jgi:ATP-binding protein involved in chromosome partitioning
MAGLPLPDGSVVPVFGVGGGEKTAKEFGVPLLAALPIDLAIREGGDAGTPVACGEGASAQAFMGVAHALIRRLSEQQSGSQELKIVN